MDPVRALPLERVLFVAAPDGTDVAGAWALTLALARRSGASVTVLGVMGEPSADWAEAALPASRLGEIASEELRASIAGWMEPGTEARDVEIRLETAAGVPYVEGIRAVLCARHDLVVVPSDAPDEGGALGSAVQQLIRVPGAGLGGAGHRGRGASRPGAARRRRAHAGEARARAHGAARG